MVTIGPPRSTSSALPPPLDQMWIGSGPKWHRFGPLLDRFYFGPLQSTSVHFAPLQCPAPWLAVRLREPLRNVRPPTPPSAKPTTPFGVGRFAERSERGAKSRGRGELLARRKPTRAAVRAGLAAAERSAHPWRPTSRGLDATLEKTGCEPLPSRHLRPLL